MRRMVSDGLRNRSMGTPAARSFQGLVFLCPRGWTGVSDATPGSFKQGLSQTPTGPKCAGMQGDCSPNMLCQNSVTSFLFRVGRVVLLARMTTPCGGRGFDGWTTDRTEQTKHVHSTEQSSVIRGLPIVRE